MNRLSLIALTLSLVSVSTIVRAEEKDLSAFVGTRAAEGFTITAEDLAPTAEATQGYAPTQFKDMSEIVVVVNKAAKGKTAQKAFIYQNGIEVAVYDVSTGREKFETAKSGRQYITTTPVGFFRPSYQTKLHHSVTWQADMEYVTFFRGGVALHATTQSHYAELGTRASGGCVRLRKENAKSLYELIKTAGKAAVQKFNRNGTEAKKKDGSLIKEMNFKTLVIVNNVED